MKGKCWCVPENTKRKDFNKTRKPFPKNEIPDGWLSIPEAKDQFKDKSSPVYGKMWIYNPTIKKNSYISKTDPIPAGWLKGRKMEYY